MYEQDIISKFRDMLNDYSQQNNTDINVVNLSESQQKAMTDFKNGKNLLIMGTAGTGKSFLIKEMKLTAGQLWPHKKIAITAVTGIAAYNINGITLNSYMGIGTGDQPVETILKRIYSKRGLRERIYNTDILIVDEVSMMSAEIFEKLDIICKKVRKSNLLFGGIQLILTGDFLQLLPVFNRNTQLFGEPEQDTRLLIQSPLFLKEFTQKKTNGTIITLDYNYRQENKIFMELLGKIRSGTFDNDDIKLLETRYLKNMNREPAALNNIVHLVTSNKSAQEINIKNLNNIKTPSKTYLVEYTETGDSTISSLLFKELKSQFVQRGIETLVLKQSARVMLIKNLDVERGLVNGSVGTVVKLDSFPVVKFDNGVELMITPTEWEIELGNGSVKAIQLPLMLCWAITIHKSQSLTLDNAVLDLADCFCDHQVFVALSRLRTLEGLYIKSFEPKKITVNKIVKEFLKI